MRIPRLRPLCESLFDGYNLVICEVSEDPGEKEGQQEEEEGGHGVPLVGVGDGRLSEVVPPSGAG